ncbi:MAG: porin [Sulfitobacter sp.]
MKKVLFASTALIATAGVAAADITFGGYGRFGLQHLEDRSVTDNAAGTVTQIDDTIIESRFRLNIDATAESDAGVTFGARLRIEANENGEAAGRGGFNGARFHAETGGFRLEVGNIAHALDNLSHFYGAGDNSEPGLIGAVGHYSNYRGPVAGYSGTGAGVNGVSAIYSVGDFRAQLSYSDDSDGAFVPAVFGVNDASGTSAERISASVAYTFSGWTVALGYEDADQGGTAAGADTDGVVLTVGGSLGVADVALFIGDAEGFDTAYGVSGRFDVGAATAIEVAIAAGGDREDGTSNLDTAFAIGFDHDLGGGVKLAGSVGRNNADKTVADLGVQFNF